MVDASTRLAFPSRSPNGSSSLSTSVTVGVSHRQKIHGRIVIAVMSCLAFGAVPLPAGQREFREEVPADAARLAAGKETIHGDTGFAVAQALVFQQTAEHPERSIAQTAGETVIFDHPSHVQVFDADKVEVLNKPGSQLVQGVRTTIADAFVKPGNLSLQRGVAVARLLPSGEMPLQAGELFCSTVQVPGIGDMLAVRQSGEPVHPEIDADALTGLGEFLDGFIEAEGDEVPAGRPLGYRCRRGQAGKLSAPSHFQFAEFGYLQGFCVGIVFERRARVLGGLLAVLSLRGRISSSLLEEVDESGLQVPQRLLKRDAGDFVEPDVLFGLLQLRQQGRRFVIADLATFAVGVGAEAKEVVVHDPATTERASENLLLFGSGIQTKAVACFHTSIIRRVSVYPKVSSN